MSSEKKMAEKLRIETSQEERANGFDEAIIFSIDKDGDLIVAADWGHMDELWGSGCSVGVPARIWAIALPWIAARMPS